MAWAIDEAAAVMKSALPIAPTMRLKALTPFPPIWSLRAAMKLALLTAESYQVTVGQHNAGTQMAPQRLACQPCGKSRQAFQTLACSSADRNRFKAMLRPHSTAATFFPFHAPAD